MAALTVQAGSQHPQLSSPAKAGDPVFQSTCDKLRGRGVLDTPLSRGMTVRFVDQPRSSLAVQSAPPSHPEHRHRADRRSRAVAPLHRQADEGEAALAEQRLEIAQALDVGDAEFA